MTGSKFRILAGRPRVTEGVLLSAVTLLGALWALEVHHALPWAFFKEQYLGLFISEIPAQGAPSTAVRSRCSAVVPKVPKGAR